MKPKLVAPLVLAVVAVTACGGSTSQSRKREALERVLSYPSGNPYHFFSNKLGPSRCTLTLGGVVSTHHRGTCTTSVALRTDGSAVVILAGRWSPHGQWSRTWRYTVTRSGQVTFRGTDGNVLPPNPV